MIRYSDEQLAVINSNDKIAVVQAGPGTGKTSTIGGKIERHLKERVSGYDFLAITFSRFGARQLQKKISTLNPQENWKIDANTFHGFALDIINRFTGKNWHVIEEGDMEYVFDDNGWWANPVKFHEFIRGKSIAPSKRRECLEEYSKLSTAYDWISYNEMLTKLLHDEDALNWIRSRYSYLFVDEAQDMTPIQLALVDKMGIENTMYVGDVNQAIYEWNGASPRILMELSKKHPTYTLTRNFRSGREIVAASNKLIAHNAMRINNENVWSTKNEGKVRVWPKEDNWMDSLSRCLEKYHKDGLTDENLVVLCRYNREVEQITSRDWGEIPITRTLASSTVRNSPEFRLFVAGARLRDSKIKVHWLLLLKELQIFQGIEPTKDKWAFMQASQHFINQCPDWMLEAIEAEDFNDYVKKFQAHIGPAIINPKRAIVDEMMETFYDSGAEVNEVGFLKWFATFGVQDIKGHEDNSVRVMTIHQAKGLEFNHVIAIEPKYLPNDEENRRIVFVAWTRAIDSLEIIQKDHTGYLEEGELLWQE
jgi:superfamily I DNA/RNA helicase